MDIAHIAKLAKLEIPEDSLEKWRNDMEEIISMVGSLPVENIETTLISDKIMPMHDDLQVNSGISRERILSNAPSAKNGYVCVPKTVNNKESIK